jgi:N-acetylmuramoyl-L-alanine amidase
MKLILVAFALFVAAPATAFAEASLTMREVPLHGERSLAATAPTRFDLVGLHWRGSGSVEFRTRSTAGRWSTWHRAAPEGEDLPDAGSAETRPERGWRLGNPYWTGASNRIAYRLRGRVDRLRAYFVQSPEEMIPLRRLSVAGSPPLLTRLSWGANESIRRAAPQYAPSVQFAVVHHTAGSNSYTRAQSAAIVRGIEIYHVKGNGWNDIGYNFLVDRYGQVFEGRYGGAEKNVIGAHAEGFNTGSTGVALIGTYASTGPTPAERAALVKLLAWRLDVAHVDPVSRLTYASGGNPRFAQGAPVPLRAVSGHRDTGFTSCPGAVVYAQLGAIAQQAAQQGLPKLYAPSVRGSPGGQVRFRARVSQALPWTVTVADALGVTVGSGTGVGQSIDWTWDASAVPKGSYAWTIEAGDGVRAASGTFGAQPVSLTLKTVTAKPRAISPDGDGISDSSRISYTLSAPATVTAVLNAPDGHELSVLFTQQRKAGVNTFTFAPTGLADGRYQIVLTATDTRRTVTAIVPVLLDRTVRQFGATPAVVSPNGDGVKDEIGFGFELTRAANVRLDIAQSGQTITSLFAGDLQPGPQSVNWNAAGTRNGTYAAMLTTSSDMGTVTRSILFRVDTVAPQLRVLSWGRMRFRISEAAVVRSTVNGKLMTRSVRAGVFSFSVPRIRTARIVAQDAAGNLSRTLRYP